MPELPEVEAFRYYLIHKCSHKKIVAITVHAKSLIKKPTASIFKKNLVGKKITQAKRVGKYLVVSIDGSDEKLVFHFGLTGALMYQKKNLKPVRFAQVLFEFADHSELFFTDPRKFGKIWLVDDVAKIKSIKDLGPDALDLSQADFVKLLAASKSKNIKAWFMDQSAIAGVGNEYSDEILFQSGVSPKRTIKTLSKEEAVRLYKKMKYVLKYAVQLRRKQIMDKYSPELFLGTEKHDFKKSFLQAHRHFDNKCPKNPEHTLKKITVAGRTAYFCPEDQK